MKKTLTDVDPLPDGDLHKIRQQWETTAGPREYSGRTFWYDKDEPRLLRMVLDLRIDVAAARSALARQAKEVLQHRHVLDSIERDLIVQHGSLSAVQLESILQMITALKSDGKC